MQLGAQPIGQGRCRFTVWAPLRDSVAVRIVAPGERIVPLTPLTDAGGRGELAGYWTADVADVPVGARYVYRLDDETERPDPASRAQPDGVHGPSAVVDLAAIPRRVTSWTTPPLAEMVVYELHVGTFTPTGTFAAVIRHLDTLAAIGVNAIELMPVAQFPGTRNWGYDGVYPFAVQDSYGGPAGLAALVDACHERGMAVILDVVYNHLGPEGNYLRDFGPYFTDVYRTPWGEALNFDGPWSDGVREYFLEHARHVLVDHRVDALRLDAIHAIVDRSATPFLEELARRKRRWEQEAGRRLTLIAESDLNDPRVIRPHERGGFGHDGQWSDDFHHALHALLTGERDGYYEDFGAVRHLARALERGYVYAGDYSVHRRRRHGAPAPDRAPHQLVVCAQNHDQVGNRLRGDRLSTLAPFEALKLAAAAVLLSPNVPLLFMGEEYGEPAPFPYFVSHGDPGLVEAVREGRKAEFASFGWTAEPPDPQAEATFASAILDHALRDEGQHAALQALHAELAALRRRVPGLGAAATHALTAAADEERRLLWVRRGDGVRDDAALYVLHFGDAPTRVRPPAAFVGDAPWRKLLDTADPRWLGPGSRAPERLRAGAELELEPWTAALWARSDEAR